MNKIKKSNDTGPTVTVTDYIENFFIKYKILKSCDLTILIHPLTKSHMSFRRMQGYISSRLTLLQKQGKIKKIGNKQWKWIKRSSPYDRETIKWLDQ